jgi:hypothetical protein
MLPNYSIHTVGVSGDGIIFSRLDIGEYDMYQRMRVSELDAKLKQLTTHRNDIAKKIEKNEGKIQSLKKDRESLHRELRKTDQHTLHAHERRVMRSAFPYTMLNLRKKYNALVVRSKLKSITVHEQETCQIEAAEILEELRRQCSHPLVLSYDGYAGSSIDDYDDAYPETRRCVVCGTSESVSVYSMREKGKYKVLVNSETRLIKRDIRRKDDRSPFTREENTLNKPISFYRKAFLRSAGCMNMEWPDEK